MYSFFVRFRGRRTQETELTRFRDFQDAELIADGAGINCLVVERFQHAGADCSESPNDGDNIRLSLRAM